MALTELGIKTAKPRDKEYMLGDGHGLRLLVRPDGKKYWRLRYWIGNKERKISLGIYPIVSLKEAREKRNELAKMRDNGDDPAEILSNKEEAEALIFKNIADEWLVTRMSDKKPSYIESINLILPKIGDMPINEITSGLILNLCRKIEARGTLETALRVKQVIGQIFRYAIATDRRQIMTLL